MAVPCSLFHSFYHPKVLSIHFPHFSASPRIFPDSLLPCPIPERLLKPKGLWRGLCLELTTNLWLPCPLAFRLLSFPCHPFPSDLFLFFHLSIPSGAPVPIQLGSSCSCPHLHFKFFRLLPLCVFNSVLLSISSLPSLFFVRPLFQPLLF